MEKLHGLVQFRVRYSDTDQMQTYYNARVLEWFEFGRNELLRSLGKPYSEWEPEGVLLPVTEAHIQFLGKARYDDLLALATNVAFDGRARLRFECDVQHAGSGQSVCRGHTIHAITNALGKPIRPPQWLVTLLTGQSR